MLPRTATGDDAIFKQLSPGKITRANSAGQLGELSTDSAHRAKEYDDNEATIQLLRASEFASNTAGQPSMAGDLASSVPLEICSVHSSRALSPVKSIISDKGPFFSPKEPVKSHFHSEKEEAASPPSRKKKYIER